MSIKTLIKTSVVLLTAGMCLYSAVTSAFAVGDISFSRAADIIGA